MSFCSLTKGITPKIRRLCVCVIINKRSFELFMCLDLAIVESPVEVACAKVGFASDISWTSGGQY